MLAKLLHYLLVLIPLNVESHELSTLIVNYARSRVLGLRAVRRNETRRDETRRDETRRDETRRDRAHSQEMVRFPGALRVVGCVCDAYTGASTPIECNRYAVRRPMCDGSVVNMPRDATRRGTEIPFSWKRNRVLNYFTSYRHFARLISSAVASCNVQRINITSTLFDPFERISILSIKRDTCVRDDCEWVNARNEEYTITKRWQCITNVSFRNVIFFMLYLKRIFCNA